MTPPPSPWLLHPSMPPSITVNNLIDDEAQVADDELEEQGDEDELGMSQNSSIPDSNW